VGAFADATSAAGTTSAPKQVAKHSTAKDIAERFEDIFCVRKMAMSTFDAGMPILVIATSFISVAKHLVRFRRLLKLQRSVFVVGMAVGMKFDRQFAISLRDFVAVRGSRNAENFVVIRFYRHVLSPKHSQQNG